MQKDVLMRLPPKCRFIGNCHKNKRRIVRKRPFFRGNSETALTQTTATLSIHNHSIFEAALGIAPTAEVSDHILEAALGIAPIAEVSDYHCALLDTDSNFATASTVSDFNFSISFETDIVLAPASVASDQTPALLACILCVSLYFLRCFSLPRKLLALAANTGVDLRASTAKVDPETIDMHSLILQIHGLGHTATFPFTNDTNILDL